MLTTEPQIQTAHLGCRACGATQEAHWNDPVDVARNWRADHKDPFVALTLDNGEVI